MIITTDYNSVLQAVNTLKSVVNTKMATDKLKYYVFKYTATTNKVSLLAYNTIVTCIVDLTVLSMKDMPKSDTYFQVRYDSLDKTIQAFSHLSCTEVTQLDFEPMDTTVIMRVHERAITTKTKAADIAGAVETEIAQPIADELAVRYNRITQFKLKTSKLIQGIRTQLDLTNGYIPKNATEIEIYANDLRIYLETLVKTLTDDKDSMSTRITFSDKTIFTAPFTYFAMMTNQFPEMLNNFVLSKVAATFLVDAFKNYKDVVFFTKAELTNQIMLRFRYANVTAYVQASNLSSALDCSGYKGISETFVTLDKAYLIDIFKRFANDKEACAADITISTEGTASFIITTADFRQELIITDSNLDINEFQGTTIMTEDSNGYATIKINFAITPETLKQLIFMQFNAIKSETITMYFEPTNNNGIKLACRDTSGLWQTKINSLMPKRGSFEW